jgi:hypothetical protein
MGVTKGMTLWSFQGLDTKRLSDYTLRHQMDRVEQRIVLKCVFLKGFRYKTAQSLENKRTHHHKRSGDAVFM